MFNNSQAMSENDIINQARERASEFVILQKPVFVNGQYGCEFQINMSDSALHRLASRSPGISELTLPYAGNPKHLSAKLKDQVRLTFFQIPTAVPEGRNSGVHNVTTTIPPLFPGVTPVRPSAPITYGRHAPANKKHPMQDRRVSQQETAGRTTTRTSGKDPLSLLRASFTDATTPVYTSAGTTLPTYCTLGHPPPMVHAQQLAALPLDLSTRATVVSSTPNRVQLHVPASLMTQEINSILSRVPTETPTTMEI